MCLCEGETVVGRVKSETPPNIPLGGVEIRVGGREQVVEASTDETGELTLI